MKLKWALSLFILLTACTTAQPVPEVGDDVLETYNRPMTGFNFALNRYVMRPFTKGYRWLVPEFLREGIANFGENLRQPVVFVNAVLQGEPASAAQTLGRFVTNTSLGVGGLFDVATRLDMPAPDHDFGQTLYAWGVKNSGPYFVLPVLGPSTLREAVGTGVDVLIDPVNWLLEKDEHHLTAGRYVVRGIAIADGAADLLDNIEKTSIDPYVALQTMYLQNRKHFLTKNQGDSAYDEEFPDMDDEEEDDL